MPELETDNFELKNGRMVEVRSCRPEDAPLFLPFIEKIAIETTNTLQVPGRSPRLDALAERWRHALTEDGLAYLGVFDEGRMVAQIGFESERPDHPWVKDVWRFFMFVLKDYWGSGISAHLVERMIAALNDWGARRVEATVRANNERGVAFYKKMGFQIEGTRKAAADINGELQDEYYIAKLL